MLKICWLNTQQVKRGVGKFPCLQFKTDYKLVSICSWERREGNSCLRHLRKFKRFSAQMSSLEKFKNSSLSLLFALCCTCSYRLVFDYLRSYSQLILGHLAQRACRHNCCVRNVLLWSRRNCLIEAGCATPRSMPPSLEDILNSKANGCLSLELVGFFEYTLKSLYFWL